MDKSDVFDSALLLYVLKCNCLMKTTTATTTTHNYCQGALFISFLFYSALRFDVWLKFWLNIRFILSLKRPKCQEFYIVAIFFIGFLTNRDHFNKSFTLECNP